MNLYQKTAQITIFMILAVMIILLIVFLISGNNDSKKGEIVKQNEISSTQNQHSTLMPVKDQINYCFKRQIKKALIIAGLKGGLIYDENLYSIQNVATQFHLYNNSLMENLGLINSNFFSTILIYSQFNNSNYILVLNQSNLQKRIKKQFENYVFENFLNCFEKEVIEKNNLKIINNKFSQNVLSSDFVNGGSYNMIKTNVNMDMALGDNIKLIINSNETFQGNVTLIENNKSTIVFPLNSFYNYITKSSLQNVTIYNLNSTTKVDIDFAGDEVIGNLFFPIIILNKNTNEKIKYSSTKISIDSRFKELSTSFITNFLNKKASNRSLDMNNLSDLNTMIDFINDKTKTKFTNYSITKKIIDNSFERKLFYYGFVDYDNKIFGKPYIFYFGYENNAPKFNSTIESEFGNDKMVKYVSDSVVNKINLRDFMTDYQRYDRYGIFFKGYEITKLSTIPGFKLYSNGTVVFDPVGKGIYSYTITTTDLEASRDLNLVFISGIPGNKNNIDAVDCFKFKNSPDNKNYFPIIGNLSNKIFNYTNATGYMKTFAYQLYIPNNPPYTTTNPTLFQKSEVEFICNKIPTLTYKYFIEKSGTRTPVTVNPDGKIKINNSNKLQKVIVQLFDSTGQQMSQEFELEIYPARCLGPKEFKPGSHEYDKIYGGSFSCCNTSQLLNRDKNNPPVELVNSENNIITSNPPDYKMDAESYFCLSDSDSSIFPGINLFNFKTDNIYNLIGNAGSVFEGKIQILCQGYFPRVVNNLVTNSIVSSGSTTYLGRVTKINVAGRIIDVSSNLKLHPKYSWDKCEICNLSDPTFSILVNNNNKNYIMHVGLKELQTTNPPKKSIFSFVPNTMEILCDDDWYAKKNSNNWIKNEDVGKDSLTPNPIEISKGYCSASPTGWGYDVKGSCYGRDGSDTYNNTNRDNPNPVYKCYDVYYNHSKASDLNPIGTHHRSNILCNPAGIGLKTCNVNYICS